MFLLLQLVVPAFAAYCGTSTIPYSFEVLPDGSTSLGCARPTCFGWDSPTGRWASNDHTFLRQGSREDGFLRPAVVERPPFDGSTVGPSTATCMVSISCAADQWAGGFFKGRNGIPGALWCCSYPLLAQAEDIGVSTVNNAQITIGGEVETNGRVTHFDYIRNIQPRLGSMGQVLGYEVEMGRMPCHDPLMLTVVEPAPAPVQQVQQSYYYYPTSSWFCFASDSMVRLEDGSERRMDELKISDRVLVPSDDDMRNVSVSYVRSWLHRMTEEDAEFIVLTTTTGREVKLTSQHFLYKSDCSKGSPPRMVTAEEITVEECVFTMDLQKNLQPSRIVGVRKERQRGIFAPLTGTGKIIVDGVAASCHSEVTNNALVQTLHSSFVQCDSEDITCTLKERGFSLALDMARLVLPTMSL